MKKICLVFLLATFIGFSIPAKEMMASPNPIQVYLNGEKLKFDEEPIQLNGTTLVQFTTVFKAIGLNYTWDQKTKTITAFNSNTNIQLTIDSKFATVNNKKIMLNAAPTVKNGKTLVPLRFISESTGYHVKWNSSAREITINSGKTVTSNTTKPDSRSSVRGTHWGMSKQDVLNVETASYKWDINDTLIFHTDNLLGFKASIFYFFEENSLNEATVFFEMKGNSGDQFITDYYGIQDRLNKTYGEPVHEALNWRSEEYKHDNINLMALSLKIADVSFLSVWEAGNTQIALFLSADDKTDISLVIFYSDIEES